MLTKEQLLKSFKRPTEKVVMPDGSEVTLRGLSAGELMAFQKELKKPGKKAGEFDIDEETFGVKLLTRCLLNEKGERYFKDEEWQELNDGAAFTLNRLLPVAMRLNGYGSAEGND